MRTHRRRPGLVGGEREGPATKAGGHELTSNPFDRLDSFVRPAFKSVVLVGEHHTIPGWGTVLRRIVHAIVNHSHIDRGSCPVNVAGDHVGSAALNAGPPQSFGASDGKGVFLSAERFCLDGRVVECKSNAVGSHRDGIARQGPVTIAKRLGWDMTLDAQHDTRLVRHRLDSCASGSGRHGQAIQWVGKRTQMDPWDAMPMRVEVGGCTKEQSGAGALVVSLFGIVHYSPANQQLELGAAGGFVSAPRRPPTAACWG